MILFIAIVFLLYGIYLTTRNIILVKKGVETLAEINEESGTTLITHTTIKYTTDKNKVIIKTYFGFESDEYNPNRTVFIFYHPKNPEFYIVNSPISLYFIPAAFLISGAGALFVSLS
jgi:hypothetical protein